LALVASFVACCSSEKRSRPSGGAGGFLKPDLTAPVHKDAVHMVHVKDPHWDGKTIQDETTFEADFVTDDHSEAAQALAKDAASKAAATGNAPAEEAAAKKAAADKAAAEKAAADKAFVEKAEKAAAEKAAAEKAAAEKAMAEKVAAEKAGANKAEEVKEAAVETAAAEKAAAEKAMEKAATDAAKAEEARAEKTAVKRSLAEKAAADDMAAAIDKLTKANTAADRANQDMLRPEVPAQPNTAPAGPVDEVEVPMEPEPEQLPRKVTAADNPNPRPF